MLLRVDKREIQEIRETQQDNLYKIPMNLVGYFYRSLLKYESMPFDSSDMETFERAALLDSLDIRSEDELG